MVSLIPPLPPPRRTISRRVEKRLRAASAILVAALVGGGLWVELRALGLLPMPQTVCTTAEPDAGR